MISQLLTVAPTDLDLPRLTALAVLAWLAWHLVLIALFPYAPLPALQGHRPTPLRPVLAALPTVQGHRTPDPVRTPGLGLD